ncbi:Phosphoserine phosphatase [Klebsiella pneumoniae 30660/NJST258_1]|nr:Phosphoserine phosphatase [Klebsiella pneumoniae 30660/NJST258_1]
MREPYSTFENLQLNVARSAGYKVASCVIFLA